MYDSRTDKARKPKSASARWDTQIKRDMDRWNRRVRPVEVIVTDTLVDAPAKPVDIDRLHAEALELNALPAWERVVLLEYPEYEVTEWHSDEADTEEQAWLEHEREQQLREAAEYDDDFGGYAEDCWLPLITSMDACREFFGGTDFIIQHTNVRRTR